MTRCGRLEMPDADVIESVIEYLAQVPMRYRLTAQPRTHANDSITFEYHGTWQTWPKGYERVGLKAC